MRTASRSVMLTGLLLGTCCAPAKADGGALRLTGKAGGYRVSVFTSPTPLRAGAVDLSVLVQDASTGDPMPRARATVRMVRSGGPALEFPVTTEAATNKLFRAALIELSEPGLWELQVRIDGPYGPAVIAGEVETAGPLPRWPELWPWIAWPAPVIALFGLHRLLVRRRNARAERSV